MKPKTNFVGGLIESGFELHLKVQAYPVLVNGKKKKAVIDRCQMPRRGFTQRIDFSFQAKDAPRAGDKIKLGRKVFRADRRHDVAGIAVIEGLRRMTAKESARPESVRDAAIIEQLSEISIATAPVIKNPKRLSPAARRRWARKRLLANKGASNFAKRRGLGTLPMAGDFIAA